MMPGMGYMVSAAYVAAIFGVACAHQGEHRERRQPCDPFEELSYQPVPPRAGDPVEEASLDCPHAASPSDAARARATAEVSQAQKLMGTSDCEVASHVAE